jgi:hypothetical protein
VKWQLSGSYPRLGQHLTLSSQGAKIAPTPIDCGGTPTNPRTVLWGMARLVVRKKSIRHSYHNQEIEATESAKMASFAKLLPGVAIITGAGGTGELSNIIIVC